MSSAVHIHRPDSSAPAPGSLTLRAAAHLYLDHLALRVDTEGFSRDAYLNIRRSLTRFVEAWSVVLANGRKVLVPMFEPERRIPLKWAASTAVEAIKQAAELTAESLAPSGRTKPSAESNGDRPVESSTNDDLARWLLGNPQWKSGHSKTNNLVAIHDCFHWVEDELQIRNPYRRKKLPKFVKPSRREATDQEYITLMRNGSRVIKRVLWCLYNLDGIRPGEMRGMLWSDFDWDGHFVLTYVHKTARKTGKPRLFAFTDRQFRFFENLYRQREDGAKYVFVNSNGKPWTRWSLATHLRRLARRTGLDEKVAMLSEKGRAKVSANCFRHTFATQADESGALEQDTAMLLGHANTNMLRAVYSKASRKVRHVRQAAEKVESLRRNARKARQTQQITPKKSKTEIQKELF